MREAPTLSISEASGAASLNGMLLFARFAFMPNHLGYCGGDVNAELLAYLKEQTADQGLRRHLRTFEGAYPYLKLIAAANGIADPLDARVVEAYWIGNDLLERVDWPRYAQHLHERFRGRVRPSTLALLVGKPVAGARAHHAFHVFDVWRRTGRPLSDGLDHCRIGWGAITAMDPEAFTVSSRPIVSHDGRLDFGAPQPARILRAIGDDRFLDGAAPGQILAFHWRWACLVLTPAQAMHLERYTRCMLALANQTL